eukprot:s2501_g15.t1
MDCHGNSGQRSSQLPSLFLTQRGPWYGWDRIQCCRRAASKQVLALVYILVQVLAAVEVEPEVEPEPKLVVFDGYMAGCSAGNHVAVVGARIVVVVVLDSEVAVVVYLDDVEYCVRSVFEIFLHASRLAVESEASSEEPTRLVFSKV